MSTDWKALKPHVPLSPGAAHYVARAGAAGDEIADWILADRAPLLVGGPAGVGKSTELARAAALLQPHRVACLVQLDRFENMRRLTPDRMRLRIIQKVGYLAQEALHLPLSASLRGALERVSADLRGEPVTHEATPSVLLNVALSEIVRLSLQGRVTLLIDGLEKVPQSTESLDLFEALASIHDEVELVVVIPWHAAFGPHAETVIRVGERFVSVRGLEVEGDADDGGRMFLREVLLRRVPLPADPTPMSGLAGVLYGSHAQAAERLSLVDDAARWSGGIPRTFLQLMADAGTYARLRREAPWPNATDLADAVADQQDSFRRILLPGDTTAIRLVAGTDGRELDLARKVRLMAHGVLLERIRGGRPVLEIHPLARKGIEESAHA